MRGYQRLTNHARRPEQLDSSGFSLRIEICVAVFIGRSPTQLVLCHKSMEKCKSYFNDFLKYIYASYPRLFLSFCAAAIASVAVRMI
jgi:uncharacterized NAD-dependent epimerase/dehydratase family protein